MPFGRYRGVALEQLEDSYCWWLGGLRDLREPFATTLALELLRRFGPPADPTVTLSPEAAEVAARIVALGYRGVMLASRPGDTVAATSAGLAVSWLRAQLPSGAIEERIA